jgi:hypothetical protein
MTQIVIDGITNISFLNANLRIECITVGPDGKPHTSGTLVIPGPVANQVLQGLTRGAQELEKKMREQVEQAAAAKAKN